jgi:hypothetical protein
MSGTYVDSVAEHISRDPATFASLPLLLAQRIFLALPVDARGRASCVCRAWRNTLAEPSLWTRLDMSDVRGERQRFLAMLCGAAGRARGELRQLDVSQQRVEWHHLLRVLTANADSLRELHLSLLQLPQSCATFFMGAAPLLQMLTCEETRCTWEDAPMMLRGEPPCAPLHLSGLLEVCFDNENDYTIGGMERFGPFAAALADAALQPALSRLCLEYADVAQPAVMGALADAAVARRLRELKLQDCTPPAAAPLARLLAEGSLAALQLCRFDWGRPTPLFDDAGAALVADALRMNTTLTTLELGTGDLCFNLHVARQVLGALVGHPCLRELHVVQEYPLDHNNDNYFIELGGALAAVIAADAPALHVFECSSNSLDDVGLTPIVEALTLNRHLRTLDVDGNDMSEAFARERLLPAVRANTTLRQFTCCSYKPGPAAVEAEELVRRRGLHD